MRSTLLRSFVFPLLFLPLFLLSALCANQPSSKGQTSFTGRVQKDRVRMRLQPHLDGHIYKELNKGDFVLVCGESDDFYAVMPPKNVPAYIFRTYVLDGAVEGSNVNVRLEPDTAAPAVCQVQSGYKIDGEVASQNNKWLKIALPEEVRFYVAKDFVTKCGDASLYREHEIKQAHVQDALQKISLVINKELQKPFSEISLGQLSAELQQLIVTCEDLPKEQQQSRELLAKMQKEYLAKGIATGKTEQSLPEIVPEKNNPPVETTANDSTPSTPNSYWVEKESLIIDDAIANGLATSADNHYANELKEGEKIVGIIKPYNSFIKNRPGDFVLVNPSTNLPIAYLYSTKVALEKRLNEEVTLIVAKRPNNNFAFPAYFVLTIQEAAK